MGALVILLAPIFMSRHETFIIKFSYEPDSLKWYGKATHVTSEETSYFTDIEDLIEALKSFVPLGHPDKWGVDPESHEKTLLRWNTVRDGLFNNDVPTDLNSLKPEDNL